jgi:hypothetical protein
VKDNSIEVKNYLKKLSPFAFLVDENYLLFYTSQIGERTQISYEYKIKSISPHDEKFATFSLPWHTGGTDKLLKYFSTQQQKQDTEYKGLYCFGIEYPLGRAQKLEESILKVYFKTCFIGDNDNIIYDNEYFTGYISRCGLPKLCILSESAKKIIEYGYDVYMVSWNTDMLTKINDYKIYFHKKQKCDWGGLFKLLKSFDICSPKLLDELGSEDLNNIICPIGFALCVNTEDKHRISFYYKERKDGLHNA